jgi:hypothetical protein
VKTNDSMRSESSLYKKITQVSPKLRHISSTAKFSEIVTFPNLKSAEILFPNEDFPFISNQMEYALIQSPFKQESLFNNHFLISKEMEILCGTK